MLFLYISLSSIEKKLHLPWNFRKQLTNYCCVQELTLRLKKKKRKEKENSRLKNKIGHFKTQEDCFGCLIEGL
jgi:hypothetical protein